MCRVIHGEQVVQIETSSQVIKLTLTIKQPQITIRQLFQNYLFVHI